MDTVTTNDGSNAEESEAKVKRENLNSSNGRSSSNCTSYNVETKILKRPVKNKNKLIVNNVGYDGEYLSKTRETQQQKCGNLMLIANNRSQYQCQCAYLIRDAQR